jgi:hypothetical protein
MSTTKIQAAGIYLQVLTNLEALMKRIVDGTPIDTETSRRIGDRADRITDEIRRTCSVMNDARFQALLHDDDEA